MAVFKCKMCGAPLETENDRIAICGYCGSKQTLPRIDDEQKANLYDRAAHLRLNNEFDKAMGIYEQILVLDKEDAEAYWSLVLCRWGIEYVEDPKTRKRKPTINRAQFTSVFDDDNYKCALEYADAASKSIYIEQATEINSIQKEIISISQKEDPFDVFICYKETDNNGRRTPDSVLANELYHQLVREGFKVFFSKITLEDKLGTAYEPYIFAALNSAKVMVVLGTRAEHFNAVWVKNEWSRFLSLIKNGAEKILIPAYKDMDPYDLPEEFSHLQAQDMSKLGFMQDIIHGIKKIVKTEPEQTTVVKETVVAGGNANTDALLERAFMFLEDGDFVRADEFCEQVLNQDPKNANAYLGKLMAELRVSDRDSLKDQAQSFDNNNNFKKAVRFADEELKNTLEGYIKHINTRNENTSIEGIYARAVMQMSAAITEKEYLDYAGALRLFKSIPGWKDADEKASLCQKKLEELKAKAEADSIEKERKMRIRAKKIKKLTAITASAVGAAACVIIAFVIVLTNVIIPNGKYNDAKALMDVGKYTEAIAAFEELNGYKDSEDKINECNTAILEGKYNDAMALIQEGRYAEAAICFGAIGDFKDAKEKSLGLWEDVAQREAISAGSSHTVGLKSDGTVVAVGENNDGECDVSGWTDIVAISTDGNHTVGLKSDGTVVAVGGNVNGQCDVSGWKDIVAISAGFDHTVGLKSDGTVVAVGYNGDGQCDVSGWKDIVAISASFTHTVGLKSDGTVVAIGDNDYGQCDVSGWKDIVAISAGWDYTVGLKSDGTVVAVGDNDFGQCDVRGWKDIVAISAGWDHTVSLKSDGTVVAVGQKLFGQCDVSGWTDIVAISAGFHHTVGLKSDGTVVAVGWNYKGECDVSGWEDIKTP